LPASRSGQIDYGSFYMSAFQLDGRVALVTGVREGIGAEIARMLRNAGATIMLANRSLDQADKVAATMSGIGGEVRTTIFSANEAGARNAVNAAVEAFGGLDIVVHNAGGCQWMSLDSLTSEVLEHTLALNLKSCFWLTQAALPALRVRGRGRILITSSVTGPRVAMLDAAHYAAAKAGVNGFIKAAALELAPDKITVNGVEPGFVAKGRGRLSEAVVRSRIERYIPLGHMGSPKDVAAAFLFLASDEAHWITGQTIVVDGGGTLPETGYAMEQRWNDGP
jgi:3-oxoacyl-[acyl-carrier protein] reductase